MTVTAIPAEYLAPGHTITRLSAHPQLWSCTCGATGRGEPTRELVDVLHDEALWKGRDQ